MDNKETTEIAELLETIGIILTDINQVNHKPHPYMIGPKHLEYSSGMYLNVEEAEKKGAKCYQKNKDGSRCTLPYDEHTSDKVMFLTLQRNVSKDEFDTIKDKLITISKPLKIDGICFIETPEQYRIS